MSKKLVITYDDGAFGHGQFKVFSVKEVKKFPEAVKVDDNLAVIIFSAKDLKEWGDKIVAESENPKLEPTILDNDDYRFILFGSSDGVYLELTDLGYAYLKKNLKEGVFVYDSCGELAEKWNMMRYKKL